MDATETARPHVTRHTATARHCRQHGGLAHGAPYYPKVEPGHMEFEDRVLRAIEQARIHDRPWLFARTPAGFLYAHPAGNVTVHDPAD